MRPLNTNEDIKVWGNRAGSVLRTTLPEITVAKLMSRKYNPFAGFAGTESSERQLGNI